MAQQNVVPSLFGLSPELYQQNRMDELQARQMLAARTAAGPGTMLNPSLAPLYAQAAQRGQLEGEGLRAIGGLLGVEDPELKKIRDVQAMSSQFDVSTAEGLRSFAKALSEKGYTDLAVQAAKEADTREKTIQEANLRQAQAKQAEAGKFVQLDLGDRIAIVDPFTKETIREIPKGMKPGEGGGAGTAGPVGKAGAYRDVDGVVYGATEMKNIRNEFTEGQKLLKMLNDVTGQDIKDAESYADWTTAGVTKGLASPKTLAAQTKLAAAQLVEQINNLPPGSASDADMRAAMKSFPGYSDPEALRQWVNRTKAKLQSRMEDISGQFSMQQKTKSSGDVTFSKGKKTEAAPAMQTKVINGVTYVFDGKGWKVQK